MQKTMKEKGVAFVLVMVILLVLSTIGLALVYWLYAEFHQAVKQRSSIESLDYCQAATQWAITQLKNPPGTFTDLPYGGGGKPSWWEIWKKRFDGKPDGSGREDVESGVSARDDFSSDWLSLWIDKEQDAQPVKITLLVTVKSDDDKVEKVVPVWVEIKEQYGTE